MTTKLRAMSIMAHQDDFEFDAGGAFALLRKAYGDDVELRVLATTRGASGHHLMSTDETFARRDAEARKSASLVGASYECLTQLDGSHPHMQFYLERNALGGLWNAIRAFEPDVIFCPPLAVDPLAGVHIDHLNTAHAVRLVAYQIQVPNAYPTINGPRKQRVAVPLIIVVHDPYTAEADFHVRVDISEVFELKSQMALCHRSQVFEWLPWTDGKEKPITEQEWRGTFVERHRQLNRQHGFQDDTPSEFYRVTRWGRKPKEGEIERIFPKILARKGI